MFALLQSWTQFQKLSLFPFGEIHGGGLQSGYDWYHRVDGIKVILDACGKHAHAFMFVRQQEPVSTRNADSQRPMSMSRAETRRRITPEGRRSASRICRAGRGAGRLCSAPLALTTEISCKSLAESHVSRRA